jgi:uncharacterized protein with GYD domain
MGKYMLHVHYNLEGTKSVLAHGGSARRAAAEAASKSAGGTLESFYFAFGSTDAYVVADLPDNVAAAALALTVSAGGALSATTTVLLSPEDIDKASGIKVDYRPPGS